MDLNHGRLGYYPGGRTALYFMEPGAGPMPANVIYDREWTTFRATGIDEYD